MTVSGLIPVETRTKGFKQETLNLSTEASWEPNPKYQEYRLTEGDLPDATPQSKIQLLIYVTFNVFWDFESPKIFETHAISWLEAPSLTV